MLSLRASLGTLCLVALPGVAQAKADFPLSSTDPNAKLKADSPVTFDPLGVAAVLYNPRADKSAARLYIQYDRGIFTWPHMTMIGGSLPPMQMLTERLTATIKWIHPAIQMCAKDTNMLPVRSDVSGKSHVFRQLPLNLSNLWLGEVVSFQTSKNPGNDFAIVYVDKIHEDVAAKKDRIRRTMGTIRWWAFNLVLDLMGLVNGAMLIVGMICGILVADIWAFTLFLLCGSHWTASVLVSLNKMVTIHKPKIRPDSTIRFAVHEREEGGTVVFKGPQDQLEEWARSTWEYDSTLAKDCLHWIWILTGTLSGIASVVCMVNMNSYMQLSFLAVLIYSSLAEVAATRIARFLQTIAHGEILVKNVQNNYSRTQAIIRATLQVDRVCRLDGLDWIRLGLLPDIEVFHEMQKLLSMIIEIQDGERKEVASEDSPDRKLDLILHNFIDKAGPQRRLAERIAEEIKEAGPLS